MHLRPHHLLCLQSFIGKGYSSEFVRNMAEIADQLNDNPDQSIRIVRHEDDICAACPHRMTDHVCDHHEITEAIDRRFLSWLQLKDDQCCYSKVTERLDDAFSSVILRAVCIDCQWIDVCLRHWEG